MKRNLIRIGAFLGGFVIVAVIAFFSMPAPAKTVSEALVVVSYNGGLCVDKSSSTGHVCSSEKTIYSYGTFADHKSLSADEVTKLKKLIEASKLDSLVPATHVSCPSFSDGSDVAYSYPTKYGSTIYTLCQLSSPEVDPLLSYTSVLNNRT